MPNITAILRWALANLGLFTEIADLAWKLSQASSWTERADILKQIIDKIVPVIDDLRALQPLTAEDPVELEGQLLTALKSQATASALGFPRDGRWLRLGLELITTLLPILLRG